MIKNDINLVFKRKSKQYSPKSLAITIVVVTVIGVGVFFGITLPTQNLAATRSAVTNLENEIAQYSALAMASGSDDEDIVATDLDTGERVVFGREPWYDMSLSRAVAASSAVTPKSIVRSERVSSSPADHAGRL